MVKLSFSIVAVLACLLLVCACATIPDVTIAYYPPVAHTSLTVTQVIACSSDGSTYTTTTTPTQTTTYSSDVKPWLARHFSFKGLDSRTGNASVQFKRTDDGRLSSLNGTADGQAQAVVTAALQVATSTSTPVGASPEKGEAESSGVKTMFETSEQQTSTNAVCSKSGDKGGFVENGKDVTVKYTVFLGPEYSKTELHGKIGELKADAGYKVLFERFMYNQNIPKPVLSINFVDPEAGIRVSGLTEATKYQCPRIDEDAASPPNKVVHEDPEAHVLCLRPVQVAKMEIATEGKAIWSQYVPLPQGDPMLAVPVPESEPFGKLTTTLALGDSGSIQQIGYDKTSGAAAVLATLAAIITFGATR